MKTMLCCLVLLMSSACFGQGALYDVLTEPDLNTGKPAFVVFVLGFGQPNAGAEPSDATPKQIGTWGASGKHFNVRTWDNSIHFNGEFDAPAIDNIVDGTCGPRTGVLHGTLVMPSLPHPRWRRAVWSEIVCVLGTIRYSAGGGLSVEMEAKP